ncbi:RNA 2'-phosphotransferase [Pseudomonas chlororaphis]|uniref:Probable RNA 2'-phosphotransferase n=1 Tax=Pseudomonas chlororaphis TaxID=587753 RepID=A0AAX3FXF5_9PSED|nr:RNA 2'-phosphotransferase [Pseudomonas chlororaphis]AZC40571.1 RNA:NAD 2'-phosphotransferase [Pseudomonas chlororaphis subsp. piscium]AZC47129.1 RNA:NAD 2'-phosphotransferase [Pseudomonas chlororaphis subsp. piscium]WDG72603.1 RNA 2'-phosphotransferase [Pseudomonas chlororaphis]WDH29611.1 RNA 2'-phosphotransferase [Pseudomonas chlororaphis]WDH71125.1 RNA 2'-phosphotransferase [Pseudomonas chlororaphis]
MSKKRLDDTSKFLSYVLRHEPQAIGLQLDSEGWAGVDALIEGAARDGRQLTPELIAEVVASNDKKRFALSEDGQRIRAVQGHSSKTVSLQLAEQQPPAVLYHGTATRFMDSINENGLIPGARHHVHLSQDMTTAEAVGQRYGKVVILKIAAQDMQAQGFKFYQAENGVWLTDQVPVGFIETLL